MSGNLKVKKFSLNGAVYTLGMPVYDEIGISFERFAELLDRDAYTPELPEAPGTGTLTYTDTNGSECDFRIGQACVYQDWEQDGGYGVAILKGVENGLAIWHDTGVYIRRLEEAELVAAQSYTNSQDAVTIAEEARTVANAARDAVSTLEGLADADTAQQELAAQVTQIAQNTSDIAELKATLDNQLLTVEMTEDGEVNVLTGENNTMLHDGYIEDTGDVVLELIF